MVTSNELASHSLKDLRVLARQEGLSGYSRLKKKELVFLIEDAQARKNGKITGVGYLDITREGKGFLRSNGLASGADVIYVSQSQIRRLGLRSGDLVVGRVRKPKSGEKYHSLLKVETVNGEDPDIIAKRPRFERLTPVFPDRHLVLETHPHILAPRMIDILSPIGRGQRGLIVSPPKAGKTTILKQIANGLTNNYHDLHLMVVLIGERPEEVTDMSRSVKAEVLSSTFDDHVKQHVRVAELALNRATRLVEMGRDVVILLDSITRLARAYNMLMPPSGRTLSGGLDPAALYPSKRFFGAARNLENSGSLTIIATCLVDTGSRMDDVIYEEFKGTGNMELHLNRSLAERRIYPAIDVERSGTRREELLLDKETLQQVWIMRRMVDAIRAKQPGAEPLLAIRDRLRRTRSNKEFLETLNRES
jgi:transcription termination factor Rho